jgi:hypothetical protein
MADKPYRPSNDTEGEIFIARWCNRCVKSDPDPNTEIDCDILSRSFWYNINDPEYPKEWVIDDADDVREIGYCTAFVRRNDGH